MNQFIPRSDVNDGALLVRDILLSVAANWLAYRSLRTVKKDHHVHLAVSRDLPALLEQWVSSDRRDAFKFKGKTGSGNISAAPWIATFNRKVTLTATEGFYLVYLFSVDLQRVYLSIAFGTTQFQKQYPVIRERQAKLTTAAENLRRLAGRPIGIASDRINLASERYGGLHNDYEFSSIYAIPYDLRNLPNEGVLKSDYLKMLSLYQSLVDNPLLPSIDRLIEADLEAPQEQNPIIKDYAPRLPKNKGSSADKGGRRLSKESKKIGDLGESIVVKAERRRLRLEGKSEELVVWHAQRGETPGWDISSQNEFGHPIFIEVKASVGAVVSQLIVTDKEWRAAKQHRERYFIYLVTNVAGAVPQIERIQDPWGLVQSGEIWEKVEALSLNLVPIADS